MVDGNTRRGGNTTSGAGGNTKREAPITWRPSPAAAIALAQVMDRTGLRRGELLNLLVISAAHKQDAGVDIVADNDQGSAATARARIHAAGMATANKPDPEKIAAFQRKCGMDVFDAKRRGKR